MGDAGKGEGPKKPKKSSRSDKRVLVAETPVKLQRANVPQLVSESPGNVIKESPRRSFYSGEWRRKFFIVQVEI